MVVLNLGDEQELEYPDDDAINNLRMSYQHNFAASITVERVRLGGSGDFSEEEEDGKQRWGDAGRAYPSHLINKPMESHKVAEGQVFFYYVAWKVHLS